MAPTGNGARGDRGRRRGALGRQPVRLGHHELYGEVNLLHQGNWVVSHERGHLVDMAQLRHDLLAGVDSLRKPAELTEVVVADVSEGE